MTDLTDNWQQKYSARAEHRNDLHRISVILVPLILLFFLISTYAILFTSLSSTEWIKNHNSWFAYAFWIIRIIIAVILPAATAITGLTYIFRTTCGLILSYHKPSDDTNICAILKRRLLGIPPLPPPLSYLWKYPSLIFKEHNYQDKLGASWLGGPATLTIYDGIALYLERGNQFSRVVGPGRPPMPFLERHETIRKVVDLRPQVKEGDLKVWSKDGIRIKMTIRMECQIDASEEARANSMNLVYPFDPIAVKTAVEHMAVRNNKKTKRLEEIDWLEGIWGQVTGHFTRYVIGHSLDELFLDSEKQILAPKVTSESIKSINAEITKLNLGAHLLSVQITSIKVPPGVDEQRIANWDSERLRLAKIRESEAEAQRIRTHEEVRATTQHDMLNTITDRLKQVGKKNMTEPILLSLTHILDQNLDDPLVRPMIAKESISLLEKIREILKQGF